MPSSLDYAVLSSLVYNDVRQGDNDIELPIAEGWSQIDYSSNVGGLGFTAGAYRKGDEIVIAFKGTDTDTILNGTTDWLTGNIPAALGMGSSQIIQAALYYQQIKAINPDANITFTGHSLARVGRTRLQCAE